jgi:hypothetical protein
MRIVAVLLIAAGIFALAYGKFSFTSTHDTKMGPIKMSVDGSRPSTSRYGGRGRDGDRRALLFAGRKG